VQWVGVTLAGGAYVAETSSAAGRGVTPLQGALFLHFACFSGLNQRFWGRYLFLGSATRCVSTGAGQTK